MIRISSVCAHPRTAAAHRTARTRCAAALVLLAALRDGAPCAAATCERRTPRTVGVDRRDPLAEPVQGLRSLASRRSARRAGRTTALACATGAGGLPRSGSWVWGLGSRGSGSRRCPPVARLSELCSGDSPTPSPHRIHPHPRAPPPSSGCAHPRQPGTAPPDPAIHPPSPAAGCAP